jgi:hypothetical protein
MKNKAQQDLLNQLNEYRQLREFDVVDKIGKGIGRVAGAAAKGVGAVAGGVAGLGSAVKQGYNAGKQTVGGGGAATPATPANTATPAQSGADITPQKRTLKQKFASTAGKAMRGISNVANYDPKKGTQTQQDQRAATKAGEAAIDSQGAKYQRDLAKSQNQTVGTKPTAGAGTPAAGAQTGTPATGTGGTGSAIGQGINQAQAGQQTKSGLNIKPGATAVPGQKVPTQVDKNKDGKDDKSGKPISKTAQDVKAKANVKAGGVALDPTNPEHKGLIAAIEKASPGLTKTVNKLDTGSKGKLLKGLQAS